MTINLANNNPRIEYTVAQGVVQTVFTVPFEYFEDADVSIYVDGVKKSLGADYTLSGGDGSTGVLTFVAGSPQQVTGGVGGSEVSIVRDVALERTTDFASSGYINRVALNTQLDTIVAQVADLDDRVSRSLHLNDSVVGPDMLLTDARKGKIISFNETTGAVETNQTIADFEIAVTAITVATAQAVISTNEAAASAASAAAALVSETNAGTSETNSASSATAAAASAVDATNNGAAQVALATAQAALATTNGAAQVNLAADQVTLATTAKTAAELAETNAETAESNAATSATNAATSATTASTGASTASTKASEAATSATNSATSATESETAKTAAEAAKDAALAALDSFDDRYLGAKASDPTLDNDGNALVAGALYYNTTDDVMKVYEGSSWVAAYASLSGALLATNNLSDVSSVSSSRTNLGLGTAATTASTAYATAAQGTLADSAVQPNDSPTFNAVTATSYAGDGSALTGLPAGYTNADVDTHLNKSTAATGEVLSWSGTDYDWIAAGGGGSPDLYAENYDGTSALPSATGSNAVAIGINALASGFRAMAIGENSVASGTRATAIGLSADSTAQQGLALGYNAQAVTGTNATALTNSHASGADSFAAAIDSNSASYGASGTNSVAMGRLAKASSTSAFSLGESAVASSSSSYALGQNATASNVYAYCLGGFSSATGYGSYSIGTSTQAAAQYSVAMGRRAKTAIKGQFAFSGERFSSAGDSQTSIYVLRSDTTDATPEAMATDGPNTTRNTTNQVILPNNSAYSFSGTIIARQQASQGTACAAWKVEGLIRREGSAGTTVLVNSATTVLDNTPAWGMALTADTTNGGLAITVTGAASTNVRFVATINTSEVTY